MASLRGLGRVGSVEATRLVLEVEAAEAEEVLVLAQMIQLPDLSRRFRLHDQLYFEATRLNLDGQMRLYAIKLSETLAGRGVVRFLGGKDNDLGTLDFGGRDIRFSVAQLIATSSGLSPRVLPHLLRRQDELSFTAREVGGGGGGAASESQLVRGTSLVAEKVELPNMELEDGLRLGVVQQVASDGGLVLYSKPTGKVFVRAEGLANSARCPLGLRLSFRLRSLPDGQRLHHCRWEGTHATIANDRPLKAPSEASRGGFGSAAQNPAPVAQPQALASSWASPAHAESQDIPAPEPRREVRARPPARQAPTGDYDFLSPPEAPPPPNGDVLAAYGGEFFPEPVAQRPPEFSLAAADFPGLGASGRRAQPLSRAAVRRSEAECAPSRPDELVRRWQATLQPLSGVPQPPGPSGAGDEGAGLSLAAIEADAEEELGLPPPGLPPSARPSPSSPPTLGSLRAELRELVDELIGDEDLMAILAEKLPLLNLMGEYISSES